MLNNRSPRFVLVSLLVMGVCFVAGLWTRPKLRPAANALREWMSPSDQGSEPPRPARFLSGGTQLAVPTPRFEPGVAVAGERVFLFSGFIDNDLHVTHTAEVFDAASDSWKRIADPPAAVTHAGIAMVGDEIWVAGGFIGHHPGPVTRAVWRYHIPTDQWMLGPLLPEARGSGGLANIDGELHFFGGVKSDRQTDASDHWSLKPGPDAVWTPRAPLLKGKNHFGLVVREHAVHLLGGQHGHDLDPLDIDDHQVYDARTDSWRAAAPLARKRSHMEPGSFLHEGKVVVSGGRSNLIPVLYDVSAYDPATDTWTELPGLPEPMRAPVLRVAGSSLHGGLGGTTKTGTMPSRLWMKYPVSALGLMPSGAGPR